jgi:hypothetical protein
MRGDYKYDVALSFAGEERSYVEAVAASLHDSGVKVFYDDYEKVSLWGKDLYEHLDWVYRKAAKYCVLFISENYKRKVWTSHERKSAQARAFEEHDEYILPARFDDTEIPGIRSTVGYLSISDLAPEYLAEMIQEKLGPRELTPGFPQRLDRLYEKLHIRGKKAKSEKKEAREAAYSLYEALERMSVEERTAVAGVLAFGCAGELPEGVHISLDYLSRMTRMPQAELVDALSAVRSLNFKVRLRDPKMVHSIDEGELRHEDKDIFLSFWAIRAPHMKDSTRIAYHTVQQAARHFCADHGLRLVVAMDFHRLSGDEVGPVRFPEEDAEECH